jgi:EAL and modified HD-GYP domain-containing signal transduction protein
MPLEDALSQLPLADNIISAILHKEGMGGEALKCVISYEHWDISSISFRDLEPSVIGDSYISSINWAKDVMSNIK